MRIHHMTLIMDSHPYFNRVICGKKQMYKSSEKEKKKSTATKRASCLKCIQRGFFNRYDYLLGWVKSLVSCNMKIKFDFMLRKAPKFTFYVINMMVSEVCKSSSVQSKSKFSFLRLKEMDTYILLWTYVKVIYNKM